MDLRDVWMIQTLITDLQNLTGREVNVTWAALSFPQKNLQGGEVGRGAMAVPVDSLLYPLYREIKSLGSTGFSETAQA